MSSIRSIKPEFWSDLSIARLSRDARLLYIALWNQADEHARLHGDPRWVKGHCLPYDDDLTLAVIDRLLGELARAGKIQRYEAGEPYLYLPRLADHQRLEPGKVRSRIPPPPDGITPSPPDTPPAPDADESAPRADSSERRADSSETNAALHVAGSMEHGAGSRGTATPRGRADARTAPGVLIPLAAPITAQTLLAEWIDHCAARPPSRVIGQLAKLLGEMLAEGIPAPVIRQGLADWHRKGQHPATLPSFVNATMNSPPTQSTADQRVGAGLALAAKYAALDAQGTQ